MPKPPTLPKVVVTYPFHPELIASELAPHARVALARTRPALLKALPDADGLITCLFDRVDEKLLARSPKLRVVANVAVGVDNIDLKACARRGIAVTNTPGVLTQATAELTLALLLAVARRVPEGEKLARGGKWKGWRPDELLGLELQGRRAVIVGPGRIGGATTQLFKALGLAVETLGSRASDAEIRAKLSNAQVLSLHLPLKADTRHWLSAGRLALLPRDAIVLNTSRGPVVDEAALLRALKARRLFGAGLDVFEQEPKIPAALRKLPNVVLLPHLGSATRTTRAEMARLAIQGTLTVLRGGHPPNRVNS